MMEKDLKQSLKLTRAADRAQIIIPSVLVVLVALVGMLGLHTLDNVNKTQAAFTSAIRNAPAAQDAAIRELLGCPMAPADCPNLRDLISNLGNQENMKLNEILSRPSVTKTVVQGRTIIITRTITVCERPNGKPC